MKTLKVATIGGGTGSYVVLTGLKKYPVKLSAIVAMTDSGGSSGKLRDELGVLPPGDIRQCLIALSASPRLLRDLFSYRFEQGGLKGHNFGNIFLSALEKSSGSMKQAISVVGKILRIKGAVVPVTFDIRDLCVELENGEVIVGETHIDEMEATVDRAKIKKAYLSKPAAINDDAKKAIEEADRIVIGPGDLYTSIIPNLLVEGLPEALRASKGKKIFVLNLMTKLGQTTNYTAQEHMNDLEKYIGEGVVDYVFINSKKPRKETLARYQEFSEFPVEDDLKDDGYKIVRTNLIRDVMLTNTQGDALRRSFIRHDSAKLANQILEIV